MKLAITGDRDLIMTQLKERMRRRVNFPIGRRSDRTNDEIYSMTR